MLTPKKSRLAFLNELTTILLITMLYLLVTYIFDASFNAKDGIPTLKSWSFNRLIELNEMLVSVIYGE